MARDVWEKPVDIKKKIRIMGHHHLCLVGWSRLIQNEQFRQAYERIIDDLSSAPDSIVETIFGYDIFCYVCPYWDDEDGRCSTGWQDKITKDAAVRELLGVHVGEQRTLEEMERLLAEKLTEEKFAQLCGPGSEWVCEQYELGLCMEGLRELKHKYGME